MTAERRTRATEQARWGAAAGVVLLILALPLLGIEDDWIRLLTIVAIYSMIVTGINLSFGYAGELILGQSAVMAAGAYMTGILAVRHPELTPILLLIASGAIGIVVGLITGVPGLRLGSWSLAIVTFLLVITVPDFISLFKDVTGGYGGLVGIPIPEIAGRAFDTRGMYDLAIPLCLAWVLLYRNLVLSRFGVRLLTLRSDPVAAAALGIPVFRLKLLVYILSAIPAGVAGGLYAYLSGYLGPEQFNVAQTITFLAALVLGGLGSVYGAIVGTLLLVLALEKTSFFSEYALVVYGALLVVTAVAFPDGLAGGARKLLRLPPLAARRVRVRAGHELALALASPPPADVPAGAHAAGEEAAAAPDVERGEALLTAEGIDVHFGGVHVLKDLAFATNGRITGLIGPNGSGKTTLLNVITGFVTPSSGRVRFKGEDIVGLAAWKRSRLGIGRTFQTPRLPKGVLLIEAVAAGSRRGSHPASTALRLPWWRRIERQELTAARDALARVGLLDVALRPTETLTPGQQRLAEVARAIVAAPEMLLLDEPAAGLSEAEVRHLTDVLVAAAADGLSIVLIDHNIAFVRDVCEHVVVLSVGRVIYAGDSDGVMTDPGVRDAYLGTGDLAAR